MTFLLNEEQGLLRDSARAFLSEQSPVSRQRALRDGGAPLGYDPNLWTQAVELGWTAAVLPERDGGLAMGYAGFGTIFEAMGQHLAALPLLSHSVLSAEVLGRVDDEAQRQHWLPRVIDGKERFVLALDESAAHHTGQSHTTAVQDNDGWILNGEKWFVMDGVGARWLLVTARLADTNELGVFLLDSESAGVTVKGLRMADSRNHAHITLHQARTPQTARLVFSSTDAALDDALDRARICLAAEGYGLVREVFNRTVDYLKQRVQFDVPIGSFQALQHRVARLYTDIEMLDSCVRGALAAIDANSTDVPLLASLAKARASDLCEQVLNEAVQLHGGIGVTDEFDLGLFVKRARAIQQSLGDALFHRDRYARLKGF